MIYYHRLHHKDCKRPLSFLHACLIVTFYSQSREKRNYRVGKRVVGGKRSTDGGAHQCSKSGWGAIELKVE